MLRRSLPVLPIVALASLGVGTFLLTQRAGGSHWRELAPGVEFTTVRGEPYCRFGSASIAALRVDPARVALRVRHCQLEPERRPLDILEWQRRTGALAVFNAGQYYSDYAYMGLLVSGGHVVSARLHPTFRAALVAAPRGGGARARVLDLAHEPLDPDSLAWGEVAQSYMLFDRGGRIRVRQSDQVASRTAVAEDRAGRIVILVSEGGYTLADFAQLLRASALELRLAMSMDGGREAEMVVRAGRFRYASFGQWEHGRGPEAAPEPPVPLPAVVTVGE